MWWTNDIKRADSSTNLHEIYCEPTQTLKPNITLKLMCKMWISFVSIQFHSRFQRINYHIPLQAVRNKYESLVTRTYHVIVISVVTSRKITLCHRCFRPTWYLHFQGDGITSTDGSSWASVILTAEATPLFQSSVPTFYFLCNDASSLWAKC